MNWLKLILEDIVNEISADDAYKRFYSSIPREDYDEILNGNQTPDKFMQFILNCVRDGKSSKEDAIEAVNAFNSADQLVKQNVVNKFRSGEYEDALDVSEDVKYLSSGNAILSRKKFAKDGLIKIKENERWIATCTANYTANNHYFGDTHWCTASDREGHYDGYYYFGQYTDNSALIQFRWKGKVLPDPDDEPEPLDEPERIPAEYDDKLGYIGDAISKADSAYQVEIFGNGSIGQCCDWKDNSSSEETLRKIIGEDMYSILEDTELIKALIKKTSEFQETEAKYQNHISELIRKKNERKERAYNEKYARLKRECAELNAEQEAFVKEQWQEFIEKKKYKDPAVISAIWERDANTPYTDYGAREWCKELAKTNYVCVQSIEASHKFDIMKLAAVLGVEKYVNSEGYNCEISEIYDATPVIGDVVVIVSENGKTINHVLGPYENVNVEQLQSGKWGEWSQRFYSIEIAKENEMEHSGIIFDASLDRAITYKGAPYERFFTISDDEILFYGSMRRNYIRYNRKNGEFEKSNGENHLYEFGRGRGISIYDDNSQTLYLSYLDYGLKLPSNKRVSTCGVASGFKKDVTVVGIDFADGSANAIKVGDNEFLFGRDGSYVVTSSNACFLHLRKNGESVVLSYNIDDDEFFVTTEGENNWEVCDRDGNTEKEKIAAKNFKDWQERGGHSTAAKAQMDKMWADRNKETDDDSGKAAFKAWNDDDRMLDRGDPRIQNPKYDANFKFNTAMQPFDKDERWRGYIGFKDPEGMTKSLERAMRDNDVNVADMFTNGEIPDYVRRNPWYRIGKDGKPIDQPWYDEDEIPANLSDRIARENKINEQYNNMRSIWDRMGLND